MQHAPSICHLSLPPACVFLLASVKVGGPVRELLGKELQHDDPGQRIHALLRFLVLWRMRWQVWPRMEDGANATFKVTRHTGICP